MDLPNETLEHLSKYLVHGSQYSFADAHPRLRGICNNHLQYGHIRSRTVNDIMIRFISQRASEVRVLDLSDCWSDSACMRELICKCRKLTELNVVNTPLTVADLLEVLHFLTELKVLSVTITESAGRSRLGFYRSIEKLYVEFTPFNAVMNFVSRLLESCPGVRNLHVNVIGFLPYLPGEDDLNDVDCIVGSERLTKYDTVILAADMQDRWEHCHVYFKMFNGEAHRYRYDVLRSYGYRAYCYERENSDRGIKSDEPTPGSPSHKFLILDLQKHSSRFPHLLELEFPDSYRQGTRGLRVRYEPEDAKTLRMPGMDALSSLVELDFSRCHLQYSSESWQSLVDSSPAVKALALPVCSLLTGVHGNSDAVVNVPIMDTLGKLKLRKLYVLASSEVCPACKGHLTGVFTSCLVAFRQLEELTINEVRVSANFFDLLHHPCTLRTLKIRFAHVSDWGSIGKFLGFCRNLRNLKLEYKGLPLSRPLFWEALDISNLEQLCLFSAGSGMIDLEILRPRLSQLLKKLDVFHLHVENAANIAEIRSMLKHEVQRANVSRKLYPVRVTDVGMPSLSDCYKSKFLIPRFPGRSLCCMKTFIAEPKPIGWDVES